MPGGTAEVWQASPAAQYYLHTDWLGNSRLASTTNRQVYNDLAYGPFGETYASFGQTGVTNISFAGNNEDTTANLYDAQFREYGIQGRWPSPDPAGIAAVNPMNPQSWNRYAYSLNNPLIFADPSGLDCVYFNDDGTGVESIDPYSDGSECAANGGDWVNGSVTSWSYDPGSDSFTFGSSDGNYNYFTTANAPGSQLNGSTCFGDCDLTYSQSAIVPSPFWTGVENFFSPVQMLKTTYNSFASPNGCDRLMASTLAESLSPFPSGGPGLSDVTNSASAVAYATGMARASGYSFTNELVQPWKSRTFRGLMGQSAEWADTVADYAPQAAVALSTAHALFTASSSAYNGTCH